MMLHFHMENKILKGFQNKIIIKQIKQIKTVSLYSLSFQFYQGIKNETVAKYKTSSFDNILPFSNSQQMAQLLNEDIIYIWKHQMKGMCSYKIFIFNFDG